MGTSIHDHAMVTLAMEYADSNQKMFHGGQPGVSAGARVFAQASDEIVQLFGTYVMGKGSVLSLVNTILERIAQQDAVSYSNGTLMAAYMRGDLNMADETLEKYRLGARDAEVRSGAYRAVLGQILQLCLEGEHTKAHTDK